jgi:deazaflavin-dependent oxidoreductase (nitroreductase family)
MACAEDHTVSELTSKQGNSILRASNAVVGFLIGKVGLNLQGASLLEVRGRKSGKVYAVPVNPVTVDGQRYLFSPRGETAWVKNIRVSGTGTLRRGRHVEQVQVTELADSEKPPVFRAYLARWAWQVGKFVAAPKDADDTEYLEIAPDHPVFRIIPS